MIKLQQIDYHYPHHPPLFEGVNLAIAKGSLFGLLGPNGAGKTTLISLMTGQLQPAAGEIEINELILTPLLFVYKGYKTL
ncbi:MAG: ATP-binding cassette domain-containing protein [Candidatus Thiodiazotropha weberae]|nr:ATP-binding cassette domain-containing protein [Candidatus Thiodiazotropha lotti]MCW4213328.1 ATP-binding cassette domain-containing protein [Candidatus Thiodiazotropha lotti]